MSSISRTPQGAGGPATGPPAEPQPTFDTKVEARAFLARPTRHAPRPVGRPGRRGLDAGRWAATYLATVTNLRPTTLATYERVIARYVLPPLRAPAAGPHPAARRPQLLADELAAASPPPPSSRHF